MRNTKRDCEIKLAAINDLLANYDEYEFDVMANKPKVVNSVNRNISPRMSWNKLYEWLAIYHDGMRVMWEVSGKLHE